MGMGARRLTYVAACDARRDGDGIQDMDGWRRALSDVTAYDAARDQTALEVVGTVSLHGCRPGRCAARRSSGAISVQTRAIDSSVYGGRRRGCRYAGGRATAGRRVGQEC